MRILFELSKEHPSLPISEASACLTAESIKFKVINGGEGFLEVEIVRSDKIRKVGERISLSFFIDEVWYSSPPSLRELLSKKINRKIKGSFRVRCWDRRLKKDDISSLDVERELGRLFAEHGMVDLSNPEEEIRVLLTDRIWYVGRMLKKIDRSSFEERKVGNRPFFSPISLHPRLARAMVNLSLVREGETLLDPFCGTGGILLEAGLMGVRIIGSDIKNEMVEGCKKILDTNFLFCCDVGEVPSKIEKVDAVVTDFPYGRATTTNREDIKSLYRRGFDSIRSVLKKGKRAVASLPSMDAVELGREFLDLIDLHRYRVHKNLTRYIVIYER